MPIPPCPWDSPSEVTQQEGEQGRDTSTAPACPKQHFGGHSWAKSREYDSKASGGVGTSSGDPRTTLARPPTSPHCRDLVQVGSAPSPPFCRYLPAEIARKQLKLSELGSAENSS